MPLKELIEFKLGPTTIQIRRGTKQILDTLGQRRDSYDDIIKKLIKDSDELADLKEKMEKTRPLNRISVTNADISSSILHIEGGSIEFSYFRPVLPMDFDFRLRINYSKIVYNKREYRPFDDYKDLKGMAEDYLRIIELIIRKHIDSNFRIDKKHLFDFDWWKRKLDNMGFPQLVFSEDIELELVKKGIVP